MISQPYTVMRVNKIGKPYVQSTDPSRTNKIAVNDMWLNPSAGTMKMWNGTEWINMQFGEDALMDNCIANRMIAGEISANKITTGVLQSQDGSFRLDLSTGEATLMKLVMGGQVEGDVIATSTDELTRVKLRGSEEMEEGDDSEITAGIVLESRDGTTDEDDWVASGRLHFSDNARQSACTVQKFQIGIPDDYRPDMGFNGGTYDGLLWQMLSLDWLRSARYTYHGARLMSRASTDDAFTNVVPVLTAVGSLFSGNAVVASGTATCTYKFNEVMQIDFNVKVTTAGSSGSLPFGLSRTLLRQINTAIPLITPLDGGNLQIFNSDGTLRSAYVGATFVVVDDVWKPAYNSNGTITPLVETSLTSGMTLVGTCYGTYDFEVE